MTDGLAQSDLQALQDEGLIDQNLRDRISTFLTHRQSEHPQPRFDLTHVLWYLGALIVIGAMGIFTTDAFNRMGGWALTACGSAYAIAGIVIGNYFWSKKTLRIPGGLLIAIAVSMVPMIIYGIQDALDLWKYAQGDPGQYKNFFPYIHGSWIYMELATILAAIIAVYFYRFPFILMIASVALWFFSMDIVTWVHQSSPDFNYDNSDFNIRRTVSMILGIATIATSWAMDLRRRGGVDLSFWLHIAGAIMFWGALTWSFDSTEPQKFLYLLINVALLGFSIFINRRIYAVLAGIGIASYLGHLAFEVFKDMLLFSFALSAIGLAIIYLGIMFHRNRSQWVANMDTNLPPFLKRFKPAA